MGENMDKINEKYKNKFPYGVTIVAGEISKFGEIKKYLRV